MCVNVYVGKARDPLLIISTTVQSGTKRASCLHRESSVVVSRSKDESTCIRVYVRTCMTYGVTYGPQTRFLYRLITQEPAINLIHRDPFYPRAYTFARENNNRHKLSAEIALVLHDLGSLVSREGSRPMAFDVFKPERTGAAATAAAASALMVSPRRTL